MARSRTLGTVVLAIASAASIALPTAAAARQAAHVPDHPAIINGSATTPEAWNARWRAMAAVLSTTSWGSTLCGGAVLDERTIVTAAHCTLGPTGAGLAPGDMEVIVGRRVATSTEGDRIAVATITRHPSFARATMHHDIAILRLERSPTLAVGAIQPTSAADQAWWGEGSGIGVGSEAVGPWIAGWGATTATSSSFPAELHEARVPIASDAACAAPTAPGHGTSFDAASMVCAGLPGPSTGSGVDTCQGDSGGPLLVGNGAGAWRLVGLTSWGRDCGGRYYGAYTRVGRYVDWIESLRYVPSPTPLVPIRPVTSSPPPSGGGAGTPTPSAPGAGTSGAPDPQGSAVGPIALPTGGASARPTRPTLVRVQRRGRGWVQLAWRATRTTVRLRRYDLQVRTPRGWRRTRSTRSTSIRIGLARGRWHLVRVQAIDARGRRSLPSRAIRVRTR